jgi:hypothetical protein
MVAWLTVRPRRHGMRAPIRAILTSSSVALFALAATADPLDTGAIVIGVRQLDVGFKLGGGDFKARVVLATGEALDVPLESDGDTEALLRVAQIAGSGRGVTMTATVERRRVLSIQCSVRPAER